MGTQPVHFHDTFSEKIIMQTAIHPKYIDTTFRCSCGNIFVTGSTRGGEITLDLCNECHPFFTGKQKLVDTGGRVERFQKRYGARKGQTAPAE
jgi:large subunit ribosomal protein L31